MESIAVYWEPVIQIYGIDVRSEISLIEYEFASDRLEQWGRCLETMAELTTPFALSVLANSGPERFTAHLGLPGDALGSCLNHIIDQMQGLSDGVPVARSPVDLVFFHGPHFQDRYGIVETVYRLLSPSEVKLYTLGCTGTSVYIVVAAGHAEDVKKLLAPGFVTPGRKQAPRGSH